MNITYAVIPIKAIKNRNKFWEHDRMCLNLAACVAVKHSTRC